MVGSSICWEMTEQRRPATSRTGNSWIQPEYKLLIAGHGPLLLSCCSCCTDPASLAMSIPSPIIDDDEAALVELWNCSRSSCVMSLQSNVASKSSSFAWKCLTYRMAVLGTSNDSARRNLTRNAGFETYLGSIDTAKSYADLSSVWRIATSNAWSFVCRYSAVSPPDASFLIPCRSYSTCSRLSIDSSFNDTAVILSTSSARGFSGGGLSKRTAFL
mmetsp:Transcript_36806/g.89145  ORF Transcript_36806/g.89145 Transcript_36806/m.89145 type:complete len:216 (+) Transcript_36806:699-1346(+)